MPGSEAGIPFSGDRIGEQEDPAASGAGLIWWRARLYEKRALAARR